MTTTEYDHTGDIGYYKFASVSCAYVWTRVLREAGAGPELLLAYHEVANELWTNILTEYVTLLRQTPENTRAELGELELVDFMNNFNAEMVAAYLELAEEQAGDSEPDG